MAIAALVTWIITAAFGFFMLGTWISRGGTRGDGTSHFRPPVVYSHFLLAAGGLVLWIVYVLKDVTALAWVAFADFVVVAVIGDVLVLRWTKDHRGGVEGSKPTAATGRRGGTDRATAREAAVQLAEQRIPTPVVILHGVFAVTTVVLVLLAALGVAGS